MMRYLRLAGSLVLSSSLISAAHAQVGHRPELSPYRELSVSSRIAAFAGLYSGAKDEAGVLPRGGALVGARWDVYVGGPADIAFRLAAVPTDRTVIDPVRPAGERVVGKEDLTLVFADVGLAFNLTGRKSWHGLVPVVTGSVGIVSDFGKRDVGGFKHGSTFSLGYGLGVRYVPPQRRLSFRADIGSYLYSLEYPTSYYAVGGDGTSVLGQRVKRTQWRNNFVMSAGVAYQISR